MRTLNQIVYNKNTMKKYRLIFLIMPALLSSLTGCSTSKDCLTYGTLIEQQAYQTKELTNQELSDKAFNEKETFLLAVHQGKYSEDCNCYNTFQNIIANYMNTYHEQIYLYNAQDQDDSVSSLKIDKSDEGTLGFYIFKGSKKLAKYSYKNTRDQELFSDASVLNTRVHKFVNKPKMYYVNDSYLQENLVKTDKSVVVFMRKGCGDCSYVIPNEIIPYINKNNISKDIWVYDMQYAYDLSKSDTASEEEKGQYQALKDRYGLSVSGNETFGYGQGVVPTIQYYEKDVLKDASVFFNDAITQNPDGTFYVSASYYSNDRLPNLSYLKDCKAKTVLEGMQLETSNIMQTKSGAYYWSQKDAAKYHSPLLKAFLDYYLL